MSSILPVPAHASDVHRRTTSSDGSESGSRDEMVTYVDLHRAMQAAEDRQSRGIRYEFSLQWRKIDEKLEEHWSTLSEVQEQMNELRQEVTSHSSALSGLQVAVKAHSQELKDHGRQMKEHGQELKEHGQELKTITHRVEALQRASNIHNSIFHAKEMNRGATHLYNNIAPVGKLDNASGMFVEPEDFPTRVGAFWRLKKRSGWSDMIRLHRFYQTSTWTEWGLGLLDYESDEDNTPLEPAHKTLEDAIRYAPEIALHQLAQHIGLDYDKIALNAEEDQRKHENRLAQIKRRAAAPQSTTIPKRPRGPLPSLSPIPWEDLVGKFSPTPPAPPPPRSHTNSTRLGWAQPSEKSRSHQASPSPTSVATSPT